MKHFILEWKVQAAANSVSKMTFSLVYNYNYSTTSLELIWRIISCLELAKKKKTFTRATRIAKNGGISYHKTVPPIPPPLARS